jgi:hypothetical protein
MVRPSLSRPDHGKTCEGAHCQPSAVRNSHRALRDAARSGLAARSRCFVRKPRSKFRRFRDCRRDQAAVPRLIKKPLRRQAFAPAAIVIDKPRSYGAALREIGFPGLHEQWRAFGFLISALKKF